MPDGWEARYLVPLSQVWGGSQGRASGTVHLLATAPVELGPRMRVRAGQLLCKRPRGWYERPPDGERRCPRCNNRAHLYSIEWPEGT